MEAACVWYEKARARRAVGMKSDLQRPVLLESIVLLLISEFVLAALGAGEDRSACRPYPIIWLGVF